MKQILITNSSQAQFLLLSFTKTFFLSMMKAPLLGYQTDVLRPSCMWFQKQFKPALGEILHKFLQSAQIQQLGWK